jgi:hypothetical protein
MPGNNKSEPIIGKRRRKLIAIGMKPLKYSFNEISNRYSLTYPNRRKNPYNSIIIPINGQPSRTMKIPPKKSSVALILYR